MKDVAEMQHKMQQRSHAARRAALLARIAGQEGVIRDAQRRIDRANAALRRLAVEEGKHAVLGGRSGW